MINKKSRSLFHSSLAFSTFSLDRGIRKITDIQTDRDVSLVLVYFIIGDTSKLNAFGLRNGMCVTSHFLFAFDVSTYHRPCDTAGDVFLLLEKCQFDCSQNNYTMKDEREIRLGEKSGPICKRRSVT